MSTNWSTVSLEGGRLCLDFINTVSDRKAEGFRDYLGDFADLLGWLEYVKALPGAWLKLIAGQTGEAGGEAVLQQARELRELLYGLFSHQAELGHFPASGVSSFNAWLAGVLPYRQLTDAGEGSLIWAWNWPGINTPMRLLWPVVWSAAEVLTGDQAGRIKECPACGWLFYDQSKNGSRTWCSMQACGSASKAKRYYQKKKSEARNFNSNDNQAAG